jgi:hypothetical protein
MSRKTSTNAEEGFDAGRQLSGTRALRDRRVCSAAGFLVLLLWASKEGLAAPCDLGRGSPQPRCLVVEVCDHTGLGIHGLRVVLCQVDRIYERAGINIVWRHCEPNRHLRSYFPYEARVYIRDRLSESFEAKKRHLAVDLTSVGDYPGPVIFISKSSVEEFIGRRRSNSTIVLFRALGRVLAHELAHRFLRTALHTEGGILRARFSRKELTEPRPCRFYFTEEQVSFLHSYAPNVETLQAFSEPVDDGDKER